MKILLALIFSAAAFGQYFPDFDIGTQQESSSIDWKQVESSSFRVIYPDGLSEQAKRVLYVLEKTHKVNQANLKVGVKKIDIILRANTTISNGFVTLAPRRSEWFVTPFMDSALGAGYWTDMLAIHEYRHVVRLDALNQGFTEGVSYVLGETGRMFATFWSTPVWFMEGDAVVMESSLTSYGRGRLPEFEAKLKALFMEQPNFNLDKILLRSYEDYIPNHYVIGFYLVSYIKETYGKDELKKIVRESSYRSFNPFAFYNAIETVLEESIEDIYTQMRTYFLTQWKKKALSFPLSYFNEISPERSDGFENYRYAWPYQGGVVAYRNGFSSPGEIVFIKDRQESHIKTIGNITSSGIKKCGDLLTWSEYAPHHRWGYQDYSEIIIYDLKNRERRRLTNRGRFFAPAFSHDCLDIVAVSIDNKLNNSLVLIHTSSGEVYKKVLIPQNELLMHPFWIPKTRDIVAVRKDNKEGQLSLVSFNLDTQKMRTYIPPSFHMIANPVVAGDHIYFRWDFNGVDNIYSINLVNGKLAQKTSSKIGAYNPVVENDSLYYSDYHATGYKVYKTSISAFSRKPNENEASLFWGEKMAQEEGSGDLMKEVAKDINIYGHTPERSPEDNFSMIQNSLYPHSWFILAPPISSAIILQAVSSDIFQQFALTAGYSYDTNQKSGEVFAGISYAHHYPVFDLYLRDRKRATKFFEGETEKDHKYYRWREQELQTGISFIINHSSGAYMREMRLRPYL